MELEISSRLLETTRQNSIRTVNEALVELITNSIDAYSTTGKERRDVWITIDRKDKERVNLNVIDQAKGMSIQEMRSAILTVGNYTSSDSSRGFFGRGAKDCSFLGNITFTGIKDGKISQIVIYQTMKAVILIEDEPVNDIHRNEYKIIENGLHVNMKLLHSMVSRTDVLYNELKNNVYLRDIYSRNMIVLKEEDIFFDQRITFSYPERKSVLICDYDVPGYNTKAHLEIYVSKERMPFPKTSDQRQFGINIQSSKTIFENSALYYSGTGKVVQDYIFNDNIRRISGVLICDEIEKLARDAVSGNVSSTNPYLVIDPSRRGGLIKDHPFTAALYESAYYALSIIIEKVQDTHEESILENGNSADFMKSLSDFMSNQLPKNAIMYAFRTHEDQDKLDKLTNNMQNVQLDSEFLGLTWEQLQELSRNRSLNLDQGSTSSAGFDISFSKDPTMNTPYSLLYLPGKVSMKINANDTSIKPFIEITDNSVNMVNIGKGYTAVANMVTDAATDLTVRKNIMQNNTNSLDINGFNEYQYSYNDSRYNIAPAIYSRVISSIEAAKYSSNNENSSQSSTTTNE